MALNPSARSAIQRSQDAERAFAQISVEGNSTATTVSASSTDFSNAVEVDVFDTNGPFFGMTPRQATNDILVEKFGLYLIQARLNFTGTASDTISAAVFAGNGTIQVTPRGTITLDSVDLDGEIHLIGFHRLTSGIPTLELWIQNETSSNNVTIEDAVLMALLAEKQ